MVSGKKYKDYQFEELKELLDNCQTDKEFNALGFYRSLLENEHLSVEQAIKLRDTAHQHFQKQFNFLQIKDPSTYLKVTLLGEDYTKGDEDNMWRQIVRNQQAILKEKRIKHRNFGTYSIHNCGYDWCPYNGMMIRQGSELAEGTMHFDTDKPRNDKKQKSLRRKLERKHYDPKADLE
ncbi:MAG TPA: hypothetical protein VGN63_21605 [Flavisolibacter sp.]|jgi:hypothetical protein|nr:hypothetical protein [Flavisolibacter sp.]